MFSRSWRVVYALIMASSVTVTFPVLAASKSVQSFDLKHINKTIKVDGKLDEPHWQDATEVILDKQNNPLKGKPAKYPTKAWMYEDGTSLYVAFKAFHPNPDEIVRALRDRDKIFMDETVTVLIDTFGDERQGYEFAVNTFGAQADAAFTDIDGFESDFSWDGIWDSGAQIVEDGFTVEMAIPFNTIQFKDTKGIKKFNFALWRNHIADNLYTMSNVALNDDISCELCQYDGLVGFENVSSGQNLRITPTLTASRNERKTSLPGPWDHTNNDVDAGITVRYAPSQSLILNATVNPDFSQIEADAPQLDINNKYSLYYAEKRPFFLDGANAFTTGHYNLLHTRNIASPNYGVKVAGEHQGLSYAALAADDDVTSFIIPGNEGSSLAAYDFKSRVLAATVSQTLEGSNYIKGLVTQREGNDYRNTVASLDGQYQINDTDTILYQVTHSDTANNAAMQNDYGLKAEQSGSAGKIAFRRSTRDYGLRFKVEGLAEDFRADLGYMTRSNMKVLSFGGHLTYYHDDAKLIHETELDFGHVQRLDFNNDVLQSYTDLSVQFLGIYQSLNYFSLNTSYERLTNYYEPGAPQLDLRENRFDIYGGFVPRDDLVIRYNINFGSKIDYANSRLGDSINSTKSISWDMNQHVQITPAYTYNSLKHDEGTLYTAHIVDLRMSYKFDLQSMLKLVVSYYDVTRDPDLYQYFAVDENYTDMSTQLIYSYKINSQTLFYLGYSDSAYKDDSFAKLERNNRTFFTKLSYAWQL